jgi:hypothetical protein
MPSTATTARLVVDFSLPLPASDCPRAFASRPSLPRRPSRAGHENLLSVLSGRFAAVRCSPVLLQGVAPTRVVIARARPSMDGRSASAVGRQRRHRLPDDASARRHVGLRDQSTRSWSSARTGPRIPWLIPVAARPDAAGRSASLSRAPSLLLEGHRQSAGRQCDHLALGLGLSASAFLTTRSPRRAAAASALFLCARTMTHRGLLDKADPSSPGCYVDRGLSARPRDSPRWDVAEVDATGAHTASWASAGGLRKHQHAYHAEGARIVATSTRA